MKMILQIFVITLAFVFIFFVPLSYAYAQNQNQTQDLITPSIAQSDQAKANIQKTRDLYETCQGVISGRDFSLIPSCIEIISAYNGAIAKLFSDHSNIVEEILAH
jgi:hypothetical protein